MVEPGASSEEIQAEVFDSFESKIEDSDIDEDVAKTVLSEVLADDPPHEFSEQLVAGDSEDNED